MKKRICFCLAGILILLSIVLYIAFNKKGKPIYDDGIKLAVRIDGVASNNFPSSGNYFVNVSCRNARGTWRKIASNNGQNESFKVFVDRITGDVSCDVDFTSNPSTLISIVEGEAVDETNNNAGYRYEGKKPNNFIWFNNEMWRIIGSIPTKVSENEDANLVKIIRDSQLSSARHHNLNNGTFTNWTESRIYILLNTYYLNNQNANGTIYCAGNSEVNTNCNYTIKGISNVANMIENVFWNNALLSNNTYNAPDMFDQERAVQDVQAYVGLMSSSDYGFASNYGRDQLSSYTTDYYRDSDWLYTNIDEWVYPNYIVNNSAYAGCIAATGSINFNITMTSLPFRPVVYLDPSIIVVSGDGSEGNPYQIVMN